MTCYCCVLSVCLSYLSVRPYARTYVPLSLTCFQLFTWTNRAKKEKEEAEARAAKEKADYEKAVQQKMLDLTDIKVKEMSKGGTKVPFFIASKQVSREDAIAAVEADRKAAPKRESFTRPLSSSAMGSIQKFISD